MGTPPFLPGSFVWTKFPFENLPDQPALVRHAACVISCFSEKNSRKATNVHVDQGGLVVGVYTSSQVQKFGDALPIGVIQVNQDKARRTGNGRAFFIDVRKRAFLPFSKVFFPDIEMAGHGLIGTADRSLFAEIVKQYQNVNDRHSELIVNVGPLKPR